MIKLGIVLLTAHCVLLNAQEARGVITGRVSDRSDSAILGVEVRAKHMETGILTNAVSADGGAFRLPFLTPGIYQVTAEFAGFKKLTIDQVEVRVGETLDLPVRLALGNVSETVEVNGSVPLLETGTASVGTFMDQRRVQDLPMRGGNPMELARLAPQVVNLTNLRAMKASSPSGTSQISVAGGARFNTEFQIDGITNTTADLGDGRLRVAFIPPSSAISEFRMEVSALRRGLRAHLWRDCEYQHEERNQQVARRSSVLVPQFRAGRAELVRESQRHEARRLSGQPLRGVGGRSLIDPKIVFGTQSDLLVLRIRGESMGPAYVDHKHGADATAAPGRFFGLARHSAGYAFSGLRPGIDARHWRWTLPARSVRR